MKKSKNTSIKMVSATSTAIESPIFKVQNNKNYILYGEDNNYPSVLQEMMNQSGLHNAILKKKADMSASKGFIVEDVEQKSFVSNINGSDTLDQIAYKNAYDLALYGGYCYIVTWSKDKKTIARLQYMDWSKVRKVKELDDGSEMQKRQADGVDFFMISSDWTQERKEKYKPKIIQGFSTEYNDATTQLVYVPMYSPNSEDVYPLPDYQACSVYIAIDTEIASYHLNSCKNGFLPSMMINLIGVPSDDEMKAFERKMQENYAGSSNASKVLLTVSEDESQVPVITPLMLNSSDERYKDLAQQVKEQIIIGHRASNEVVGVAVAGKLGASSEVIEAEAMFQHNVIDGYQSLLEKSYTRIMNLNGIEGTLKLEQSITFDLDEVQEETTEETTNE
tara:strand:+ start:70 stop:1245 length:1176 start_codon:yes stop_codon:yes gene_type:complete